MARSCVWLGALWLVVVLAACGGDSTTESSGDEGVAGSVAESAQVRACDLLDLEMATGVIGSGAELPGGDSEALTCMYTNAGVAILTAQLGTAESYDQITILQPHTPADVGARGRYNVQNTGEAAVQFVKGAYSVTLNARPLGAPQKEYLDPLLAAARDIASRLP